MLPVLRKGPLFTKKHPPPISHFFYKKNIPIFHFFTKKHPPFHFLPTVLRYQSIAAQYSAETAPQLGVQQRMWAVPLHQLT